MTRYDSPIELPIPKIFLEPVLLKLRDGGGVWIWTGALSSGRKFDLAAAEDRDKTEVRFATRSSVRAWDLQLSQAIVREVIGEVNLKLD
jgi:hypothetical protein